MYKSLNFIFYEILIILLISTVEIYITFLKKTFLIRIYFIEKKFDFICKLISKKLPNIQQKKRKYIENESIIISTRLQKGGGLGKIIENLVKENNSEIILTNLIRYNKFQSGSIKTKIHNLNNFGFLNKIITLNNIFIENNLSKIYILNDPSDPIPYIAYLRYKKLDKNFVFHHHADTCYSFGMYESNWEHEDYFQNQYIICKQNLKTKLNSIFDIL